jgi:hypothetical protein
MKGSSIILLILLVIKSGGNGGSMKGSSILYCHPERAKDIKPHKHVLSVLESITLSIPMQQGKARSHGKGAREKGAKAKE